MAPDSPPLARGRLALALAASLVAGAPALATAAELTPLAPGRAVTPAIQDDRIYQEGVDVEGRIKEMADIGARFLRVDLRWDLVSTGEPAAPRDPDDPAYDWSAYDRVVDAARENGLRLIFTVWGTPAWAAHPGVPASPSFPAYATRPRSAADFGKFGAAAVARYRPRGVRHWEAWNEPNIPLFLRPQYVERNGRFVPASPAIYARMLKSFYREAKDVAPSVRICGGVTAPAGDPTPTSVDSRIAPLAFYARLAKSGRPKMDAVCHHPYPITKPRKTNFPGASYVDLYNLETLVEALDRSYLRGKSLWLTEFGFSTESVPQYKLFFSQTQQAAFLVDAFKRVRPGNRVGIFTWYVWQDNSAWKSGLLNEDGTRKRAFEAYALPATTDRAVVREGESATLLGQVRSTKGKTRVTVQRRRPGRWINVGSLDTGADGSFRARLSPEATARYRVVWRGETRTGTVARRASPSFRIRVK